jgi:hypothetical protein
MKLATSMLLGALVLSGCDKDVSRSEAVLQARRSAIERPQLWSVRAVGQAGESVQICANRDMRAGFIRPSPSLGGRSCTPLGQAVRTAYGWSFRCMLGADTYAVSSAATGDRARAFETQVSITPLQGRGQDYHQTLRYVRLGACPAGWEIGQAADRRGVRGHTAIGPPDDAAP